MKLLKIFRILVFSNLFILITKAQNCINPISVYSCLNNYNVSASCNNNVFCDPANLPTDVYTNISRAVVKIVNSDGAQGSGTLLRQAFSNNDDNQQENIIITARHVIRQGNAGFGPLTDLSKMVFIFNYSSNGCSNNDQVTCKSCRYVVKGATLIDESLVHDIAVLRINNPIPPHYKPFYSGWTANPVGVTALFFNIHHPQGDIKKISSANGLLTGGALPFPTRYNINWNDGASEQGSSGSGLWNFNRRIVGVLSGNLGGANCNGIPNANFGKFRNFWLGNSVTRNKLNPNNQFGLVGSPGGEIECYSGDLFLDGDYWPAQDYQPNNQIKLKCVGNMFLAHSNKPLTVKTNAEFVFEAGGQIVTLLPGFTAEAGSNVSINSNVVCSAARTNTEPYDIDTSIVAQYIDDKDLRALEESVYLNGIKNYKENFSIEIYPNPTKNKFTITSNSIIKTINVVDALGRDVSFKNDGNTIDISDLSPGVYFVITKFNDFNYTNKIVLQK
jgi:hypothetical protein